MGADGCRVGGGTAGVGDAGAAVAGARGFPVVGFDAAFEGGLGGGAVGGLAGVGGCRAGDGAAGVVAAGTAAGCLGGLPRFGLVAAGVSASTAAGWQFSQWCLSIISSPFACFPVTTSRTDLPTRRRIGKGPSLIVSREWLMEDFPLFT